MKRCLSLAFLVAFLLTLIGAPSAFAADFRTGTTITIGEGEVINDDLYLFATTITIDGTVNGDLIAAGTTVTINGTVNGTANLAGTDVVINGTVAEGARIAANSASIAGTLGEDLLLAVNTSGISADAVIGRDLILAVNTVTLDGAVERRISGVAGTATMNGSVGTDVEIGVENLTVTDNARIGGNLAYTSENMAEIADAAEIGGEVTHETSVDMDVETGFSFDAMVWNIIALVMAAVYGTVLLFGFPRLTVSASNQLLENPLLSLGMGVVFLIVVPILAVVVMITVVGIPLGLIALLLYGVALFSAQVFVGMTLGRILLSFVSDANRRLMQFLGLLLGLLILFGISYIPYVGSWAPLIVAIFGLGGLMLAIGRLRKEQPRAASPPAEA